MADWRVRPLSKELFEYARADTHFLLYVYDNMRNELVEKSDFSNPERNKVQEVLQKSKETALQRYEHPIYDTELGLGPVWLVQTHLTHPCTVLTAAIFRLQSSTSMERQFKQERGRKPVLCYAKPCCILCG